MTRFHYTRHRNLLWSMVARDIRARYRGSWLGLFWVLINPVLLLLVYYFAFSMVFRVRLPTLYDGQDVPFAGFIFSGMIMYLLFAEVMTRTPGLIQDNTNYVKKVVFPVEIIPLVTVLGAAFNFLISIGILCLFLLFSGHGLTPAVLAVPLVVLPYLLFLCGLGWLLSALGVYLRDVVYVAGFLATAMMFLSPVFYPMASVPDAFRAVMEWNPLTGFIEGFRDCLIGGQLPDARNLTAAWLSGIVMLLVGHWFFQRVRQGFADIL